MEESLKLKAIDVNVSFNGIMDLTRHSRKLAINAQVASSRIGVAGEPFSVLVQELIVMSEELTRMIVEVEDIFAKMVNQVAKWDGENKRNKFFTESLNLIIAYENAESAENSSENETEKPDKHQFLPGTAGEHLENILETSKTTITNQREGLFENAKKLSGLLGGVRNMTQKHSKYLAITAKVESVRVSDYGEDLIIVAENISQLTADIAKIHEDAEDEVYKLIKMIETYKQHRQGAS